MIVLDTNVISELFRPAPNPNVVSWLTQLDKDVAITAVTLAELTAAVRRLPAGKHRDALEHSIAAAIVPYRASGAVLPFDESCADPYADILCTREREGLPITTADAQIAAICRAHGATCATRNTKDFLKTGIRLINPWTGM